ncbi:MAG: 3-phosphoserine/phosphohydroxythreonine transaminase [Planctomycetota bacterium]|nr:MAG: 3-phosphoserine/phosphohydroxythreonine transaminase [Planctomycetota bacterium]
MTQRAYNFSAGPATLPLEVLEEAREALLSLGDLGAGILEVSHRGPEYTEIHESARARLLQLLGAGSDWELLFLQGGASLQFTMVPQNLGADADYVLTGNWSQKAIAEARLLGGDVHVAASSEDTGFDRIPTELDLRPGASFVHVTSNNTVRGTQWPELPRTDAPLVVDMSSDILSRPVDLDRVGLIYAGAQKNLGPAGVTLVLIRKELLARTPDGLPTLLRYTTHAEKGSRFNTPPVFAIYVVGLVARWIESQGGVAALAARNEAKAQRLYAAIDASPLYEGTARPESRSRMNVTFRITRDGLEEEFLRGAAARGLLGLKGHRSVGGLRASIYNAMPPEGVDALVRYLDEFAAAHA